MLIDDKLMELFSIFVPVHTRTNLCECPIQTQFVRHIEMLKREKIWNTSIGYIYWKTIILYQHIGLP